MTKHVYGVGVNDAGYVVKIQNTTNGTRKLSWVCPFYRTWKGMLERCYSKTYHTRQPTYIGCTVSEEWKTFSKFKAWMEIQDWQGKQLDKDLLVPGNKVYSAHTCVFVSGKVNKFVTESTSARGAYPIGVYWNKNAQKFAAQISGMGQYLGLFDTPEKAHEAWLAAKLKLAKELAAEIIAEGGDARVAKAIVARYENYGCT